MFNFTQSPGGKKFGNIWVSGSTVKRLPNPIYYDFHGPIVSKQSSLFAGNILTEGAYAAQDFKTYPHASLISESANYKLWDIDEYMLWDELFGSTTQVDGIYRGDYDAAYGYGAVFPDGDIKTFNTADGESIGMRQTPNGTYFYGGIANIQASRTPFAYRILGKYLRMAEETPTGTPTQAELQQLAQAAVTLLGSYSDAGKVYAGSKREIIQPTGSIYTAPEIPTSYNVSGVNEVFNLSSGSRKYTYEKGLYLNAANDNLAFLLSTGYEIGYSTNPAQRITDYLNPYAIFIYPLVPYIYMEQSANIYSYSKAQRPRYYPSFLYGSQTYDALAYGGPDPDASSSEATYQSLTYDAPTKIGFDTTFEHTGNLSSYYKKLAIKYNVREQLYKIPINTLTYRYGGREFGSNTPITCEGFVGYISLFEIDPSLLPS